MCSRLQTRKQPEIARITLGQWHPSRKRNLYHFAMESHSSRRPNSNWHRFLFVPHGRHLLASTKLLHLVSSAVCATSGQALARVSLKQIRVRSGSHYGRKERGRDVEV